MSDKDFISLLSENLRQVERVALRLRPDATQLSGIPRQQVAALVRLHVDGAARLKDIAGREVVPTPNLCAMFRKLERDGLICRTPDEEDRRNVWYSVTPRGAEIATNVLNLFHTTIDRAFANLNPDERTRMKTALRTINDILKQHGE